MRRLFALIRLYAKYLLLVPLFLFSVAVSAYVTERAVNRYYVGRDLRLLAAAAEQFESDHRSKARVEQNRPRRDDPSTACAGRITKGSDAETKGQQKRPPDLGEDLPRHVRHLIHRNWFSAVIIAEQKGTVVAQEPSSGPRFSDLSGLLRPARQPPRMDSTVEPYTDFEAFAKASNVRTIQFAGQDYWIFAQPFQAYLKDWKDAKRFVLVGLLPVRSLWSAPLDFTRRSWVVALLGTLAVLAFWPMLKMWFTKPGAELRPFEVFRFVYSLLALASIATFALLYLAFQHQRELNIDYRLDQLARQVRREASRELKRAVRQLEDFDSDPQLSLNDWAEPTGKIGADYPAYDAATWIDENGCQLFQYVKEGIGYAQNLGDREYFKQIRNHGPWTVKLEEDGSKDLVIEAVRSRATALPAAALAVRSAKGVPSGLPPVAVMTIPFESIMKPVLPDDYGFALVDANGKVDFHSDPSRGAGENILIETGNNALLYASLIRRTEKAFTVLYQGAPHRVHVTRFLIGTPWSLVVFHNLAQAAACNSKHCSTP